MMARIPSALWRNLRAYQVFGANTDVGKTIFSTLLCRSTKKRWPEEQSWYLKPVSTGSLDDADLTHLTRHSPNTISETLFQFNDPVSPHLAARANVSSRMRLNAANESGFMLVETAGGPHSPGPSGTLQADLYRPLRLPVIFVADWHLGGISTSISAFESLKIRGYDVEGVAILQDSRYKNYEYLSTFFAEHKIPFLSVPQPPPKDGVDDNYEMEKYYRSSERLAEANMSVSFFMDILAVKHEARISRLESMATDAYKQIWWPFTQHRHISPKSITTVDSAYGDYFQTLSADENDHTPPTAAVTTTEEPSLLKATVDGSASWWTQGLGHANTDLTLAAAYAAGRYGHVMFAEAINEPSLGLASDLLRTVKHPRLTRCFYSDNGSTGMEVAIKMALKATTDRYGWEIKDKPIEILGLQGSYHGDTMGTMDMSEPSVYNEKIHWYKGRGFWFETPSVKMRNGKWIIEKPMSADGSLGESTTFASLQQVFDLGRDTTEEAALYESYITKTLERLTQEEKRRFGALVMEPVVLGAGGMLLSDPLFQRTLVNVIRRSSSIIAPGSSTVDTELNTHTWTGLPVISDEVFTGLYRLGHASSSQLLNISPDIAVHAKLLTGGLVPLACTLASESIYETFLADGKADALLHGHSYTAHPVGCTVGIESLKILNRLSKDGSWDAFRGDWCAKPTVTELVSDKITQRAYDVTSSIMPLVQQSASDLTPPEIWSVWSTDFVHSLSHETHRVDSIWALGSVLAISLKDAHGGGYTSLAAKSLQRQLLAAAGVSGWNIHSRVLGNVLYLMTSQTSQVKDIREWESLIKGALSGCKNL